MAAAFSDLAPTYDDFYSTSADLADSDHVFGRARRQFRAGPPGVLIDLGCGPGTALHWNVADPDEYVGIDVAPGMVSEARERWPEFTFLHGDHRSIQPRSAVYVLGGFGPFQYVRPEERRHFAECVVQGLVPGGRFLLMARPGATPTRALDHDVTFGVTPRELLRCFSGAGANELRVEGHRKFVSRKWNRNVQKMSLRAERMFPLQVRRAEWLVIEGQRPGGWYRRGRA